MTDSDRLGRLISIVGGPGTGSAAVASAAAQAMAADGRRTVLADLSRTGHHRALHDIPVGTPGLSELVHAHRRGPAAALRLDGLLTAVPGRNHLLLGGVRHPTDWVAMRASGVRSALHALLTEDGTVIAEVDSDLEGESQTGSIDIDDRNVLARTATTYADLVVVTCSATTCGLHALPPTLQGVRALDVSPERVLVVVTASCRGLGRRRSIRAFITAAVSTAFDRGATVPIVFVAAIPRLDQPFTRLASIPCWFLRPIASAIARRGRDLPALGPIPREVGIRIAPGELGGSY